MDECKHEHRIAVTFLDRLTRMVCPMCQRDITRRLLEQRAVSEQMGMGGFDRSQLR